MSNPDMEGTIMNIAEAYSHAAVRVIYAGGGYGFDVSGGRGGDE